MKHCSAPCFQFQVMKFWYELLRLSQISIILLGFRFLEKFDLFLWYYWCLMCCLSAKLVCCLSSLCVLTMPLGLLLIFNPKDKYVPFYYLFLNWHKCFLQNTLFCSYQASKFWLELICFLQVCGFWFCFSILRIFNYLTIMYPGGYTAGIINLSSITWLMSFVTPITRLLFNFCYLNNMIACFWHNRIDFSLSHLHCSYNFYMIVFVYVCSTMEFIYDFGL
jgi:hypothetical protein